MSNLRQIFEELYRPVGAWVHAVDRELGWNDELAAFRALRATLRALRDRLPVGDAVEFGQHLPRLLRGDYYEGWHPDRTADVRRDVGAFFHEIEVAFRPEQAVSPEKIALAVLSVLSDNVSREELDDVRALLPAALRGLLAAR